MSVAPDKNRHDHGVWAVTWILAAVGFWLLSGSVANGLICIAISNIWLATWRKP